MIVENPKPSDFDWVTARNDCSLAVEFTKLQFDAKKALETRLIQKPNNSMRFVDDQPDTFVIVREGFSRRFCRFYLTYGKIQVASERGDIFVLTLTLNNDGVCRFRATYDGGKTEELDRWQVLRKALESILFDQE